MGCFFVEVLLFERYDVIRVRVRVKVRVRLVRLIRVRVRVRVGVRKLLGSC